MRPAVAYNDDPAAYWSPVLGRLYGIRPMDMLDLRRSQFEAIRADVKLLEDAAKS